MKTLLTGLFVAASALAFTAAPAAAGTAYYLNGDGGLKLSHTKLHSDGVTTTATASSYDPKNDATHTSYVGQYSKGLGVTNSVSDYVNPWNYDTNDGSHAVDGSGWHDTVWVTFSKAMEIEGALFSYVSSRYYENVTVVDGNGDELGDFDIKSWNKHGFAYLDLTGLDYVGTKIGFTANHYCDGWKLKAVKASTVPTPTAAAAGLMTLGCLCVARRRRSHKA